MTFEAQQRDRAKQKELEVMSILLAKAQEERQLYLNHLIHAMGFIEGFASRLNAAAKAADMTHRKVLTRGAADCREYAESLRRLTKQD